MSGVAPANVLPTSEGSIYFEGQTSVDPMNAVVGDFYSKDRIEPFSVFVWYKADIDSSLENGAFFDKTLGDATARGWKMGSYAGSIDLTLNSNQGTGNQCGATITAPNDGLWHHICFTYLGNSVASSIQGYIDGQAVTTTPYVDALGDTTVSTADLIIGSYNDNGYASLKGFISEAGICNDELSASAVEDLYNGIYPASLEALWIAQDNNSATMLEAKNGVNNATINGGVWSADSP